MTEMGYTELFQVRGNKYDNAMRLFPSARDEEFLHAIKLAQFNSNHVIIDVPAGGGYLEKYLPTDCLYQPYEPCTNFTDDSKSATSELLPLPFDSTSVDIAFSMAGLHHLTDKTALFDEFARVSRPQGQLILADVYHDSNVANFLDNFVGAHNSTGHNGIYLNETTLADLVDTGWEIISARRIPFFWKFKDRMSLADFCRSLFDMREISTDEILTAVEQILGISQDKNHVKMHWELFYIQAQLEN